MLIYFCLPYTDTTTSGKEIRQNMSKYNTGHNKAALSQISALKWRVEVIQGQAFYAHWKTDKLLHVAV